MVGRLVRKHRRITHDFTYSRGASQRKPAAADSRGDSVGSKVFGAERTRWRAEDRQATNYKRLISQLFAADESSTSYPTSIPVATKLILTPTFCLAVDVGVDPIVSLFSILGALALGAISPGPSFLFVARTAVAVSRRSGIASAIGMGLGASIVCALAMLGVRAVFARAEWLYVSFKLLGGIYLCYLAWRLWRGGKGEATVSADTLPAPTKAGVIRSLWLALATQLSNPKTLIVISGIFAALLPSRIPAWMYWTIPLIQLVVETSWYAFVALALSSKAPRLIYLGAKGIIDRTAGGALGMLGLRLILESAKEVT